MATASLGKYEPLFPYPGGKSRIASEIWARFGDDVRTYCEPFAGSAATFFLAPETLRARVILNDADGFIANFWRSVKMSPEATAKHADNPIIECDHHARHAWLVGQREDITRRLEGDPEWHDPRIAGWWAWGISSSIREFGRGIGPWKRRKIDGQTVLVREPGTVSDLGISRQRPTFSCRQGVCTRTNGKSDAMRKIRAMASRLTEAMVACGDWSRVCKPAVLQFRQLTAVLLDPPYHARTGRDMRLYAVDSGDVADDVRNWAIEHGDHPKMRIALCGLEGEHRMPKTWRKLAWKTTGGYSRPGSPRYGRNDLERIWFSPHCLRP